MEAKDNGGNAGEKENQENIGIPDKKRQKPENNLEPGHHSLPSDGPVSQSEGTESPDLDKNLEHDDPVDLGED
jgi:hypothetical protein